MNIELKRTNITSVRDPFKEVTFKPDNSTLTYSDLMLTGIMWEEDSAIVVINDQIFKEGDVISGFKIEKVLQGEVLLTKGTERHVLRLFSEVEEKNER